MRKPRLVQPRGSIDPLVYERIKLTAKRMWHEIRELEDYKRKRGLCILGMMCGAPILADGTGLGNKGCAHHVAAMKSGVKLKRLDGYVTEYMKLRQVEIEREKAAKAEKDRIESGKEKARAKLAKRKAA